jgi:predicted Rdx family selenoprotein
VAGNAGEFTVWVDEAKVIEKQAGRFPEPKEIVEAVRARGA